MFGIVIIYGIYRAIDLAWTCDDIYITFRYVDNFLSGMGVVFNPGEHVEGYTHFFWLIMLSLFRWFGIDLASISIALGIISYVCIIAVFLLISKKLQGNSIMFFPFAALALSLNYDFAVWATSGLETSFFTLLVCLMFFIVFFTQLHEERKLILSGLLLALLCMTRPDGIVFFVFSNAVLTAGAIVIKDYRKNLARRLLYLNGMFILLLAPYVFWKLSFYHDIFPNTFYAKNAGESYLSQGLYYIWLFVDSYKSTFVSAAVLVAFVKLLSEKKSISERLQLLLNNNMALAMLIGFLAAAVYLFFFVAWVGGDFMFARFIIPVLPLLYFSIESSLKYLLKNYSRYMAAAFLLLLVLIFYEKHFRDGLFENDETSRIKIKDYAQTSGITDERLFYTSYWELFPKSKNLRDAQINIGKVLEPYFRGMDITVVVGGARNYMGYFAGFKNIIVDNGLTDKFIASQTTSGRKRVGHEKSAPLEYLIKRKAILGFYDKFRNDVNQKPYAIGFIRLKELGIKIAVEIIYYDILVINQLKARLGEIFSFMDMESYVKDYVENIMKTRSIEEVKSDYRNMKEFYFDHNNDPHEKEIKVFISE